MNKEFLKWILFLINFINSILWLVIVIAIFALIELMSSKSQAFIPGSQSFLTPILAIPLVFAIHYPLYQLKQIIKNLLDNHLVIKRIYSPLKTPLTQYFYLHFVVTLSLFQSFSLIR